jgi:unsaturated rhamnogalacturonyl hydrolase
VSEAASAAGPSSKAVRLYETIGLLPPAPRTRAGYRTHTDDVAVLRVIHQAKTLGLVLPFLIRYGRTFGDSAYANDEVVNQLLIYASHLQVDSGLFIHAWDESGQQPWADPVTHRSPEHWCRAIGWYGMASTQVLDELPADHPKRQQLIDVVRKLAVAMARFQDPATGRWFQVVDKGSVPGNWTETSCSSMYTYTIAKSVERGYLPLRHPPTTCTGWAPSSSRTSSWRT